MIKLHKEVVTRFLASSLIYSFLLSISVLLLLPLQVNADISKGYNWLAAQQQSDGSVDRSPSIVDSLQATAQAVLAFNVDSSVTSLNKNEAIAFIAANEELSTEFISRALLLGITEDANGNNLFVRLISHRNSDGGFGSFPHYDSNTLDTALALSALVTAKNEYSTELSQAVAYLLSQQQSTGAYTLYTSEIPLFPLTAIVTIALQQYVFDFNGAAEAVARASRYILENKMVGAGVEHEWQSALALLAVVPSIRDSSRYADLVNGLNGSQLDNGSWSNDVYTTTLAIQALQLAANITFPEEPTTGQFAGRILDNNTGNPIKNASVTLSENQNISAVTNELGRFTLDKVSPGEYNLNYQVLGYIGATQNANIQVGQVTNLGDISLNRLPNTATVFGTVTDASSKQILPNAVITFTNANTTKSVTLDANAAYSISLTPGQYSFTVSLAGYQALSGSVKVNAGNNIAFSPNLYLEDQTPVDDTVTVIGKVVDTSNNTAITNATLQIANVTVSSGVEGKFKFEGLAAGELILSVSADGYTAREFSFVTTAGSTGDTGTIVLAKTEEPNTNSVFGKVVNSKTGEPILGATISVEGEDLSTASLSDGSYALNNISSLKYTLFISSPGFWSQRTSFSVDNFGGNQFDVALTPSDTGGFAIESLLTNQAAYSAYSPVAISANLVNPSDVSVSAKLLLEIFDEDGKVVGSSSIGGALANGNVPGEPIIILPDNSSSIETQWYTGIFSPGSYSLKLSAYDQFTSQLLSEKVSYFDILPTAEINDAKLIVAPRFSNAGAEENVIINLSALNRSNIPVSFKVDYQWRDPQNNVLKSEEKAFSLSPDQSEQLFLLDEQRFIFEASGSYSYKAKIASEEISETINIFAATIVAPSVRVEATQKLMPNKIIPNENKRITIDIKVEGVE